MENKRNLIARAGSLSFIIVLFLTMIYLVAALDLSRPIGVTDYFKASPDGGLEENVSINDINSTVYFINSNKTLHGQLLDFKQDGSFWYITDDLIFHGVDYFDYFASNGVNNSTLTRVWINVNNTVPKVADDKFNASDDGGLEENVSINDGGDVDRDIILNLNISKPFKGQLLEFKQDGSFIYITNDLYFHGVDYFDYIASDGYSNSTSARVVIGVNDTTPVAVEDKYIITNSINTTNENGILFNDSDVNEDVKYASVVEDVKFGKLIQNKDFDVNGSFNYTSNKTDGVDYFTYLVSDLYLNSNTVKTIFVIGNNTAPKAIADVYNYTLENKTFEVNSTQGVLTNDTNVESDILFAKLVNYSTLNGSLNFKEDGSFIYIPTVGFNGIESFTYLVTDLDLNSAETTVKIYVNYTEPIIVTPIIEPTGGNGGGRGRTNNLNVTNGTIENNLQNNTGNGTIEETLAKEEVPTGFFGNLLTGNVIGAFGTTGGKIGSGLILFLLLLGLAYWIVAAKRKKKGKKVVKTK